MYTIAFVDHHGTELRSTRTYAYREEAVAALKVFLHAGWKAWIVPC